MEGSETYNHSKGVGPRRDASKQCLNKMHGRENAHMPLFCEKKELMMLRANGPPSYMRLAPPPGKKNHAPPPLHRHTRLLAPLSGKKNLGPGHWQGGEGGKWHKL